MPVMDFDPSFNLCHEHNVPYGECHSKHFPEGHTNKTKPAIAYHPATGERHKFDPEGCVECAKQIFGNKETVEEAHLRLKALHARGEKCPGCSHEDTVDESTHEEFDRTETT